MKKYACIVLISLLLASCSRFSEDVAHRLIVADMVMEQQPDSAFRLLQDIEYPQELISEQYARYCLSYTAVLDRLRLPMTSDSLINIAVKFFGRNPERYSVEAAHARYYLARVYQESGRKEEAMDMYLALEPDVEALKNNNLLGLLNSRMGLLLREQNLIDQSTRQYHRSTKYFKQANSRRNEGYSLSDIGYNYMYLKQYDSSVVYFQEARAMAMAIKDTLLLSAALMNLGIAHDYLENPEAVKLYLLEVLRYEKTDDMLIQTYNYLANVYFKEYQYESARFYANKALEMSEKYQDSYKIYGLHNSYLHLYDIALAEGNLRTALEYAELCSNASDSIAALEARNNVLAVQEKYKAEELKAENMRLLANRESERFMQMLGIFAVSLGFMIIALIRVWHQRKILKQKELMLRKEARINSFLVKRLDVSKEIVAMAQYPVSDAEKLHQKFKLLVESLSFKLSDQRELLATVNELFDNFAEKLTAQYPQMTNDEVQLCCMVRCGFDAGLMATSLGVNLDSVYKKRSRLRKKISLDQDEDFETFLQNL